MSCTKVIQVTVQIDPAIEREKEVHEIENKIRDEIKKAEADIRAKYPIFHPKYQDALGLTIFFGTLFLIGATCYLYLTNLDHPWSIPLAIFSVSFLSSFIHEFEHDLVHNIYFRAKRDVHNFLYYIIWIAKANYSPWARKYFHLHHHRVSGQMDDIEQRVVGLGLPLGWRRLVATAHPIGMLLTLYEIERDNPTMDYTELTAGSAPVIGPVILALTIFLTVQCGALFFPSIAETAFAKSTFFEWIYHFNILIIIPLVIRQCSLMLMGNMTHYYGDIPNTVYYQNQILDHWFFFPFQFLSWNLGATHIVHHYVPTQPFYIRQLVFYRVRDFMVAHGVRRNDLASVLRGNRYFETVEEAKKVAGNDKYIPPLPDTFEARFATSFVSKETVVFIWAIAFVIAIAICFPIVNFIAIYGYLYHVTMKALGKMKVETKEKVN